uniref:Putative karyopherin importin beta 3 n=1 Tax=Panstrongylus lignarius TaxID=156445 RepID=A0A224X607_9HEMI
MEGILLKLMSNNKDSIDQGTQELKRALAEPHANSALMHTLATSQDSAIRQYAAVILKRKFNKSTAWEKLQKDERINLKANILKLMISEPEKSVKKSIAVFIGTIIKYEMSSGTWPELLQFLQNSMTSSNTNEKELGFYTCCILLETSPISFLPHANSFTLLFNATINSLTDKSSPVAFFAILCLTFLAPIVKGNKELTKLYCEGVPNILEVIKSLSNRRPDRAVEVLDFLFEFAERDGMAVLLPKLKLVVNTCLDLVVNCKSEEVKIKALSFIGTLARVRVKILLKDNLLNRVLDVLFTIMCSKPEDDNLEEYFTSDPEDDTLVTCACETLDDIAMNINPITLLQPMMSLIKPPFDNQNSSPYQRKAAYLCLGIISQGCSSYVRSHLLEQFIQLIYAGMSDSETVARNAALFTVGQFAEHLQPEISSRSSDLLPLLISQLKQIQIKGSCGERFGNRVDRLFFAIERFAENLEKSLAPFAEELIECTIQLASPPYHKHIRQLALGAVATIVGAMKEDIMPYFDRILLVLRQYLGNHNPPEEEIQLQVEALDALAMLARSIGSQNFESLAVDTVKLGLDLLAVTNDPDIRKSSYGVFSSVSTVLKQNMAPMLATIVPLILTALRDAPSATAVTHLKENEDLIMKTIAGLDDICKSETEDESGGEHEWEDSELCVENDYIEEKEEACMALSELAANTGDSFLPFMEPSFVEVFRLLNFPNSDVRKAALEAAFTFCTSYAKIVAARENQHDGVSVSSVAEQLVSKAAMLVRIDDDKDVVMAALEGLTLLLKEVGTQLANSSTIREQIVSCVRDVFNARTEAQGWKEDDDQWNADEDLMDAAGFIVPTLANIMTQEQFLPLFSELLPLFMERLAKAQADEDEANTIGTLAECMAPLGTDVERFLNKLLTCFLVRCKSSNSDVRNNSLFALGEMALHGKQVLYKHYNEILTVLSQSIASEKNGKVMDNACGVIARLIITNSDLLPLDQVLPVFVSKLPLREDFDEDKYIYWSLTHLFQKGCHHLSPLIAQVVICAAHTLHSHSLNDETKEIIINLIKQISTTFPQETSMALIQLPQEVVGTLNSART